MGFLKDCDIRLDVEPLDAVNIARVYELSQRTNQMNFSGNRYPQSQLAALIGSPVHGTYVIKCADRFGSYGIVGFAVVDITAPRLLDLMFSCRIQSKRVEHAFLSYLLKRFVELESRNFFANYRRTAKNAPSGKVFEEMGFEQVDEADGLSSLVFREGRAVPDDGIVRVQESEPV
jgi:FkbH-like protein